jgi:poly-gamma-glutamate biosynthesis protein PgsC/CapC
MIITSFGLGIFIGFIFFEMSGLTAGGIIVPGYLALYVQEPQRIVVTILISLIVYGIVALLSRYCILYGRRRFFLMILTGFIIRYGFDMIPLYLPESGYELKAIGYIIPGLIANEFYRQGIVKTILAIIVVVTMVFLLLTIIFPGSAF